jgi:hypothetical protein
MSEIGFAYASYIQSFIESIEDHFDADTIDLIGFIVSEVCECVGAPRGVVWEFDTNNIEFAWGPHWARLCFNHGSCDHYKSDTSMSVQDLRNWDCNEILPVVEAVVKEIQANEKK